MKLLTFLGTGNYRETIYTWQGKEKRASFAPLASIEFLRPAALSVFLTEEAEQEIFPAFRGALPGDIEVETISIPLGRDDRELWNIFASIGRAVREKEEVAFDITHGLRSFQVSALLAAAFLRSGLHIHLQAVLYGAYDVRDQSASPSRTPMFDLSPMIALLDWSAAADRFNRTGDARFLAELLEEQKKEMAQSKGGAPERGRQVFQLGKLASTLRDISQSLRLIRPEQAMQQIDGLEAWVEQALPALEQTADAQPFSLLLNRVLETYNPLAHASPSAPEHLKEGLAVERRMIHWYSERQQWVQAVSLAREWLLSWVMSGLGITGLNVLSARQRIEKVVGSEAREYRQAKQSGKDYQQVFLGNITDIETVLDLWLRLTEVRNDIDHAGKRENPQPPDRLTKNILSCIQQLESLPL